MAMQSTGIDSPCNVNEPVTRPGWSMWLPWLNGGVCRDNIGCMSASYVRSNVTWSAVYPKR